MKVLQKKETETKTKNTKKKLLRIITFKTIIVFRNLFQKNESITFKNPNTVPNVIMVP